VRAGPGGGLPLSRRRAKPAGSIPSVISVLIDLPPEQRYSAATVAALDDAAQSLGAPAEVRVVPTETIDHRLVADPGAAVVVGPGSPYRNPDGVLEVVRSAREEGIPLVGT
jgi:CTP synthase (UTP-ammonia lyase)